jgi:hypothetical protein
MGRFRVLVNPIEGMSVDYGNTEMRIEENGQLLTHMICLVAVWMTLSSSTHRGTLILKCRDEERGWRFTVTSDDMNGLVVRAWAGRSCFVSPDSWVLRTGPLRQQLVIPVHDCAGSKLVGLEAAAIVAKDATTLLVPWHRPERDLMVSMFVALLAWTPPDWLRLVPGKHAWLP